MIKYSSLDDYFTAAFENTVQVRFGTFSGSSKLIAVFHGDDKFIEAEKYCKLKQKNNKQKGAKNQ